MRRPSSHLLEQKWPRWEQMLPHLALSALLSACRLLKWHWHGWDTKWTALPEEVNIMRFVRQLLATRRQPKSALEMVLGYNRESKWDIDKPGN